MTSRASSKSQHGWWLPTVLIFSLFADGTAISIAGRTPTVLLFDLLLPLVVAYMLAQNLLGTRHWNFRDKAVLTLGSCYFFAQLLSLLFNLQDIARSVLLIKVTFFGFLIYWVVIARNRSATDLEWTTSSLIAWGGVVGFILLYRFVTDWSTVIGPTASYDVKDLGISMGRSNYLAALLVPIFPLALAVATAAAGWRKLMPIIAAFAMAIGLLITFSKGAALGLLGAAVISVPVLLKNGVAIRHILFSIVIATAFLWMMPRNLVLSNYEMIVYRLHTPDLERPDLWRVAWHEFVQHPIVGIGPNCIYIYNRQFAIDVLHTHNFVLNWLAELGVLGSVPFFAIMGVFIRRAYRLCFTPNTVPGASRVAIGLYVGLLATLLHGLVEPTFQGPQYSAVFWFLAALIFLYEPGHGISNLRPVSAGAQV